MFLKAFIKIPACLANDNFAMCQLNMGLGCLSYVCDHSESMLRRTTFLGAVLSDDCPNIMLSVSV
jgi:hypothetical protein